MTSQYTHKMVDGELVELTPEEVAACEAQEAAFRQSQNVSAQNVGYGPTIKETLVIPPRQGPI